MRNLPVLASQQAGVLCSVCPEPGHCCELFAFHKSFWIDEGLEKAQRVLMENGLPFHVLDWAENIAKSPTGREYASLMCSCPKLSDDGRCTIYADRPGTCVRFQPGSDPLCVFEGTQGMKFWTEESKATYLAKWEEKSKRK